MDRRILQHSNMDGQPRILAPPSPNHTALVPPSDMVPPPMNHTALVPPSDMVPPPMGASVMMMQPSPSRPMGMHAGGSGYAIHPAYMNNKPPPSTGQLWTPDGGTQSREAYLESNTRRRDDRRDKKRRDGKGRGSDDGGRRGSGKYRGDRSEDGSGPRAVNSQQFGGKVSNDPPFSVPKSQPTLLNSTNNTTNNNDGQPTNAAIATAAVGGGAPQFNILQKQQQSVEDPAIAPKRSVVPTSKQFLKSSDGAKVPDPSTTKGLPLRKMVLPSLDLVQDNIAPLLGDFSDFVVIGVIGRQGVGKSTVASILAGWKPKKGVRNAVFPLQTLETQFNAGSQTNGIDMTITQDRVIILDMQPLLSPALLLKSTTNSSHKAMSEGTPETHIEVDSVMLMALLLQICHVMVVVTDRPNDLTLWRLLSTASIAKSRIPEVSVIGNKSELVDIESGKEYSPRLVCVHNKADSVHLNPKAVEKGTKIVNAACKLASVSSDSNGNKDTISNVTCQAEQLPISYYCLPLAPELSKLEGQQRNFRESFEVAREGFCHQMWSLPRRKFQRTISEKEWLRNSGAVWSLLARSPYVSDYAKTISRLNSTSKQQS